MLLSGYDLASHGAESLSGNEVLIAGDPVDYFSQLGDLSGVTAEEGIATMERAAGMDWESVTRALNIPPIIGSQGFLHFSEKAKDDGRHGIEILSVGVPTKARGKGAALKMHERVEQIARERDLDFMLEVLEKDRPNMCGQAVKMGYSKTGETETGFVYEKKLK